MPSLVRSRDVFVNQYPRHDAAFMQIIPVIDLSHGLVVRAVRGDRARYAPIESALCGSSDPCVVAARLLQASHSAVLYVADIDALTGKPAQARLFMHLLRTLPQAHLWLDAGFTNPAHARDLMASWCAETSPGDPALAQRITPVLGTESLATFNAFNQTLAPADWVLSLDQRHGQRIGANAWFDLPQSWPDHVIVMNLDQVGAASGPDLGGFGEVMKRNSELQRPRRIVGAGGIRDEADCAQAARAGAHAWLVASALHDLRIATTRTAGKAHDNAS